ncbi:DNA-binding protein modulo [Drosophila ficusphila]|uniref:DNA-binding protein modulo n=1 Tax=Drosophila ficusphila TaxID=30025 RepID=UPI0007E5C486|nr:DNA-binding protein modulo [Drosophila ficusphila]
MAQKKVVAAKGKKAANGVEKQVTKRGAKPQKVQVEEEESVVAQSPSKKTKKQPVKEVPTSSEEESDAENQNSDQAEEDSDSEEEGAADFIDDEAEEDDSGEEDADEDEVEPGEVSNRQAAEEEEDSDDDDEAPIEQPVSKKGKESEKQGKVNVESGKKGGIPKIRVGKVPPGTPKNQTIFVTNLPNEYKHKDVVALFAKFGPISALHRITNKYGVNSAIIAFETPAAAEAALQAKPKALTLGENVLSVSQPRDKESFNERTVVVGLIGPKVTKEELKAVFEKVAPVESVTLSANRTNPKAFVRLLSVDDVPKALSLHSTELFSRFITVREVKVKTDKPKSIENTLVIENLGKHESFNCDALEKIFKKFGEVDFVDVVCSKTVLAFVTFKQAEAASKALTQLQGKTINNLELKLQRFERSSGARSILVTNLTSDTTEDDLREVFNESGEIESIQMLGVKAVVKFTNDDGFCKSFLANERIVNNHPIFIEPNSLLKHRLIRKRAAIGHAHPPAKFQKNGNKNFGKKPFNKRPAQENGSKPFVKRAKF